MTEPRLSPGSDAARRKGCTCPIIDNAFGAGASESACGRAIYVIKPECPLHGEHVDGPLSPMTPE